MYFLRFSKNQRKYTYFYVKFPGPWYKSLILKTGSYPSFSGRLFGLKTRSLPRICTKMTTFVSKIEYKFFNFVRIRAMDQNIWKNDLFSFQGNFSIHIIFNKINYFLKKPQKSASLLCCVFSKFQNGHVMVRWIEELILIKHLI